MKRSILIASLIAASAALAACGSMGGRDGDSRGQRGHGNFDAMRQAATTACQGKTEGAQVNLETPRGKTIPAVCVMSPKGELHAMPAQMVERMKAAKQACVGKASGDTVQIPDFRDASKTMDATCTQRGDALFAQPKNMKRAWDKDHPMMNQPAQTN
ncbi:MAG: hypothetical protein LWW76_02465 [Burkholderiales bacterium]|jgi:predicted small secreted protein|nr:hypothetical protein [Burkholderiales bacterium]